MTATTLIVGNSPTARRAIANTIKSTQLFNQILFSADGLEAVNLLKKHAVDMVFFDLRRLSKRAVDLFGNLRNKEEWNDIPVVAFTPVESEELRIRSLELGASDCLTFNTSTKEVTAKVRLHLKIKERLDRLRTSKAQLAEMALKDGLTGLYNRSYFDATLEKETARCQRSGQPFSLVLFDLDHFKRINDTFGHLTGDRVIQIAASVIAESARNADVVCRYGGEEFAAILPETSLSGAYTFAERIRKKIAALDPRDLQISDPISTSIGICCSSSQNPVTTTQMVARADKALYAAKNKGRNRVEIFRSPLVRPPVDHLPSYHRPAVAFA